MAAYPTGCAALRFEVHLFAGRRMRKGDGMGLKTETAIGGMTIELIADDRTVEPIGVGAVQSQLMGTLGVGCQVDMYAVGCFVMGDGFFSMDFIHHLPGTVFWIGTEG